jgi:hypothetical protein
VRTLPLSTKTRDRSIVMALHSWVSITSSNPFQTPATCQSLSPRQQVMPLPQPISWENISQRMPETSTRMIPVFACRSDTPGRLRRLVGLSPLEMLEMNGSRRVPMFIAD